MAASFSEKIRRKYRYVDRGFILIILTAFQTMTVIPAAFPDGEFNALNTIMLFGYILFEWVYVGIMHFIFKKVNFELEFIAFFLSGIGLVVTASVSPSLMKTQLIAVIAGVIVYDFFVWFLKNAEWVMKLKYVAAIGSLLFLAGAFVLIRFVFGEINGAYNWLQIGGFSLQPSELVKIAFVFVGASTLDKIMTTKNIYLYIGYAMGCIGVLFLMKDFGTALIFFFTFLVIAFMRSGDIRSLIFICAAAVLGAVLIVYFKPHVAARFAAYRHVWDDLDGAGYQQTRTLIYSVSGGLFGVGLGNGRLRGIFASTTDLVFGVICEEFGIIIAFLVVMSFGIIMLYAIKNAQSSPSAFYSIAACAAAAMLLFQVCLNVFGITDLLPLTGVTLPFVSRGGSSMICSWALFAFIKAADIRSYPKIYKN
ncbi:MAG: FtsW/RodA/SpoVE family cell cycle protein [Clostridia bacterium]|nr:FtsW/RodA/SpoVE family cell cycle protein [Clostridia bacterium]